MLMALLFIGGNERRVDRRYRFARAHREDDALVQMEQPLVGLMQVGLGAATLATMN
jgi:hypothetical protein